MCASNTTQTEFMNIRDKVSRDLNISLDFIHDALTCARSHVRKFHILKRSGQPRRISQPSAKLKTIQYWLLQNIIEHLPINDCALGYRKGLSILDNAFFHSNSRFFLRADLEDFFPSISFEDLWPIVQNWHESTEPEWDCDQDLRDMIRLACFDGRDRLPIGYPSSPSISNVVMMKFDIRINKEISNPAYGNMLYTRYADDLVFSTDLKGACILWYKQLQKIIKETDNPNLVLNKAKTRFGSSSGGSAIVTGLRVAYDGHITIHRHQKDSIRLMLSLLKKGKLKREDYNSLLGHLSYCHHVAPSFYTKLQQKYFNEITLLHNVVRKERE